jgi:hypothetical protein
VVRQVTDRVQTIGESASAVADRIGDTANDASLQQEQAARITCCAN